MMNRARTHPFKDTDTMHKALMVALSATRRLLTSVRMPCFSPPWSVPVGWRLPLLVVALGSLTACSPTFNWREVRPEDTGGLQALMPCKPEAAERLVPLQSKTAVPLRLRHCDVGGLQFTLAWVDVGETAHVPEALALWRRASLASLKVTGAEAETDGLNLPPVPGAERQRNWQGRGMAPDGRAVQARLVQFARGARLYQVAVYGPTLPTEVLDTFFAGVRLP